MIRIYATDNEADIAVLASLFESQGIPFHLSRGPLHAAGLAASSGEKCIFVSESDEKRAKALIEEYIGRTRDSSLSE